MKLNRSLCKAIAAGLVFTTFSPMLAGCGSNRGLTTGGLSGKGVVGDFLVGGMYGGVFGDFMRPGKPLPEGAFIVELPRPNDERLLVELVGMDALRYYTHARIATEKLSRMNKDNSKPEEYEKLLRETIALWQCADHFADTAEKLAKRLAEKETKPGYEPLAMTDRSPFGRELFFSVANAAGGIEGDGTTGGRKPGPRGPESWGEGEVKIIKRGTQEWAKNIEEAYKNYPAGKEIEGIAKNLHVDTATAKRAFLEAKQVLDQEKGKQSLQSAQLYNIGAKTAMATRVACKTGLLIGSAILTGGATGAAATAGVVNALASGADLVIEVSNTALEMITDKTDPTLDKIQQYTSTIAAITSLGTLATSLNDFALRGQKAVQATQEALQKSGLQNTTGFLDKFNIGGSGIAFLTDSTSWTVDRGLEFSDGKILGFKMYQNDRGQTVVIPTEMPKEQIDMTQPLDQVAGGTLDPWMNGRAGDGTERKMTIEELEQMVDELKKIGQANSQAKEEEAKKDAKDASYTPDKIAGTYVLTSKREVKIDEKTVIRYDPQVSVRPESGNRITLIRSNGKTTSIQIDPRTGRGSFTQTIMGKTSTPVMQFTALDGGGYTLRATDRDGTATWRKQ